MAPLPATTLPAQVLISTGGTNTVGSQTISWSVGEPIIGTSTVPAGILAQGSQQPNTVRVRIHIAAFL